MNKKKVLILAYDYPPYSSVGAQRPHSFLLHFKKYGFEPIIVTRFWDAKIQNQIDTFKPSSQKECVMEELEQGRIYRAPFFGNLRDRFIVRFGLNRFALVRKFLTIFSQLSQFVTLAFDSKKTIYQTAEEVLQSEKDIAFIIATGEPFILFRYASLLSAKYQIPWIADYRDGWSTNHTRTKTWLHSIEMYFEKKFTSNVSFFTTVSDPLLKSIGSFIQKPGLCIPNGVELSLYQKKHEPFENFSIVYTGIFYNVPNVDCFIEGFERFLRAPHVNPEKVDFYMIGTELNPHEAMHKMHALKNLSPNHIFILPRVSAEEAARYQQKAHVLASFIPGSQADGIMAAKTYYYAATKNPILIMPSKPGTDTPFFPGRDIQHFVFTGEEVYERLNFFYSAYLNGTPFKTSITDEEIFSISREYQVKRLAEHMSACLKNRSSQELKSKFVRISEAPSIL